jgi:hypothetical protein
MLAGLAAPTTARGIDPTLSVRIDRIRAFARKKINSGNYFRRICGKPRATLIPAPFAAAIDNF